MGDGPGGVGDREAQGHRGEEPGRPRKPRAALQERLGDRALFATDSGNGTFLAAEGLRLDEPGRFLAPVLEQQKPRRKKKRA